MIVEDGQWAGWEAYIVDSDGTRLPEYGAIRADDHKSATFFVEATAGQTFSVCLEGAGGKMDVKGSLQVDSIRASQKRFQEHSDSRIKKVWSTWWHEVDGQTVTKSLQYSTLNLAENGHSISGKELSDLGTITVKLEAGVFTRLRRPIKIRGNYSLDSHHELNEKIKKAAAIGLHLGGEIVKHKPPKQTHDFKRHFQTPAFTFKILYRTRATLMDMGYIDRPQPPTASTPPPPSPVISLSPSPSLLLHPPPLRAQSSPRRKLKRERLDNPAPYGRNRKRYKVRVEIDLTQDDSDDAIVISDSD